MFDTDSQEVAQRIYDAIIDPGLHEMVMTVGPDTLFGYVEAVSPFSLMFLNNFIHSFVMTDALRTAAGEVR